MIDLSFLTEAEQEAILKVLQRDSELKKAEEQRVRDLQENVNDENELKYKSGQWFYDAKSKRHRDKIHGADLVRASIRKRKKPATIERYGVMDAPDEAEEDLMPSKDESNQSAKRATVPFQDINLKQNGTASPARQRKNPFNSKDSVEEIDVHNEMPKRGPDQVNGQEPQRSDLMSSVIKYGVKLPYPTPIGSAETSSEPEDPLQEAEDPSSTQPPVPKPRKLVVNGQPPSRSNSSLQREDSLNGTNKRRGILKRRSSSSSTDSESIRIPLSMEPIKLVSPASPILEAEQSPSLDDQAASLENSPDRQKQVRFSEKVLQKPPTPNPESYNTREMDEFGILDPNSFKKESDYEFIDQESIPTQYSDADYPIVNAEEKPEDSSRRINDSRLSNILDESHPDIGIDSAGTESLYAVVKKPSKPTSSDQDKDFDMDGALMEPKLLGQRGKSEPTSQSEQSLEFGKSYGGAGKINYGSPTTSEPGKVAVSGKDLLAQERTMNVQSSYHDFEDEPKPRTHDDDNVSKWRRPQTLENEDLLEQPQAEQAFPDVNIRADDTFVQAYPENKTKSKYSPGENNVNTPYKSIFLRNTPEVEEPSSNSPVGQNMPLSSTPENKAFQTKETLNESDGRDLPTSANFKVMSLKDRIHDTPEEQMSNPSQFQSLKHFWNVEDKSRFKGDVDASPKRILTDVLKRNKATRADPKQKNSKEIPAEDCSLPSSFDSLSEEEQTSQKVASWLAQTSTAYGAEQVDPNEDEGYPDKKLVDRKKQAKDFSSALQKQTEEALEAPKLTDTEHQKSKDIQISPFKEQKKSTATILVNSTEKSPAARFYGRVVQISGAQSPEKETKIVADTPEMTSKQYPGEEVEESVGRTAAPVKTPSEYKIGLQKLLDEHDFISTEPREHQVEESNLPKEKQQLIETKEIIEKSSILKGNDNQEFISALNKLEIEASKPSVLEDQDEQPQKVSTPNTVSLVKPSFKIGFEHLIPSADDTIELPQKSKVTYTVQSSPPCNEDMVKTTTVPSRKDENDLANALRKLEHEAAVNDASAELEDTYEKPNTTPALQGTRTTPTVQNVVETPSFDVQSIPSPSHLVENKSNLEDPYSNRTKKSTDTEEPEDTYVTKAGREKPQYMFEGQGKFPVEEQPIDRTIITNEESSASYRNQLMRLEEEEESAALVPGERTEESIGENVSLAPTKEVFAPKKVFSSNESTPTELPPSKGMPEHASQPQPYAYKELAKYPQSPSDQSGSFTGSAGNVPCKKPDNSSAVSNSKQGKPAPTGSPNDSNSSRHDKYTFEGMKAQEESISKVLDWFSRRSDPVDDQLPSSILMEKTKTSPQQMFSYTGKLEDEAPGSGADGLGNTPSQKIKSIPILESNEDLKTIDDNQLKILNTIPVSPPQESLEFGKSGSGCGKIKNGSIDSFQTHPQLPVEMSSYTGKIKDEAPGSGADGLVNEDPTSQKMKPNPESKEDLKTIDDHQINILNTTPVSPSQEPLTESLEFGKTGSGCGKIQNSSIHEDSVQKYPQLPVGMLSYTGKLEDEVPGSGADGLVNEETPSQKMKPILESKDLKTIDDNQLHMLNTTPVSPSQESLTESLEFGKTGSGCGKIQNRSIDDNSIQKYPQLPVGMLSDTGKIEDEVSVSDADGLVNEDTPSQNIKPISVLESKEDVKTIDDNQLNIINTTPVSPSQVPLTESLEFGSSGSGCGKIQNREIDDNSFKKYPQLPAGGVLKKDQASAEGEKEKSNILKKNKASLDKDDTGQTIIGKTEEQTEALIPTVEQSEDQSSEKPENDKPILPQKRVSDIKLLWERDKPSLDATKKLGLSSIKRPFSPLELSVTPKSRSFDKEEQNSASLVTFRKVMVEDDEDALSPVDQKKSLWENEKYKDTTGKMNESGNDDKETPLVDSRLNDKKRHTSHDFFDREKSTDPEKNLPARSVSLSESAYERDHMKPTSFQSLKNFWNTSSKSEDKSTNKSQPETTTKQFGSNPDLRSKEPFISRTKGRLAAKSLQDIREDPSTVSQLKMYNVEPVSRKFGKGSSKKEDLQNSVNKTESENNPSSRNNKPEKPIILADVAPQESSVPPNYLKSSSIVSNEPETNQAPGISDEKPTAPTEGTEKSFAPIRFEKSAVSLRLKPSQNEVPDKKVNLPEERPQIKTFEMCPDDQNEYRDEENGEMNEKGQKMLLTKQSAFDAGSPVLSNISGQENEKLSENESLAGRDEVFDSREIVNENVEKTVIPRKRDLSDFNGKLQNLHNESLNTVDSQSENVTEPEYMEINESAPNFSKVLAGSLGNGGKNVQSSGTGKSHQPIIINISSKNTEVVNENLSKPQRLIPTQTSLIRQTPSDIIPTELVQLERQVDESPSKIANITSQEPTSELQVSLSRETEVNNLSDPNSYENVPQPEELTKQEIIESIEKPVILPKTRFNFYDKLKQLDEEQQNSQPSLEEAAGNDDVAEHNERTKNEANVYLHSSEPKKTFFKSTTVKLKSPKPVSADRETLSDKTTPPSPASDVLLQEVNETVEKTAAPKRVSTARSLEDLQKEFLNVEEAGLVGNVLSSNESHSKRRDQALREDSEDSVPEGTEHAEEAQETRGTFMSHRQSTPVNEKNGSLQKSTLELYLEAPYRREISKSMNFDISGYVTSDANKRLDDSHPVLSALKRSTAKTLNSKAVQEVSPTSTNQNKVNNQKEVPLAPTENSFPENAEKFKQMSQSVPSFLQDDTDGRETDSASESSFQIGRHKKSPSSLTNLSGSSGMASMSSVSGSVMSVYSGDFGNVDIKGSIEFAMDYVEQLKEFHIFIYQCKDLAAADVKKQRSDPYVKAYLLPEKAKMGKRKTAVKKKTLNPVYNEILRYKIPKQFLQSQTLNLSVWHHDALGRNSFLGEVNQNLAAWDWNNTHRNWYQLEARTPASGVGLENRGEIKLSLKYIPVSAPEVGKKVNTTGEVHIWIKDCLQLPMLRENKINSFVKCTILPDTSRKSRQKTRTVDKTPNPIFNHTMVYDGFKEDDLKEACVELTVWDHNKLTNHFLGGLRIGLGTGKSYGTMVDWMDSSHEESIMWEKMIGAPNTWIEGLLPLRMFKMAKMNK